MNNEPIKNTTINGRGGTYAVLAALVVLGLAACWLFSAPSSQTPVVGNPTPCAVTPCVTPTAQRTPNLSNATPTATRTRLPVSNPTATPTKLPASNATPTPTRKPVPVGTAIPPIPTIPLPVPSAASTRVPVPVGTKGVADMGHDIAQFVADDVQLRAYHDGYGLVLEHQPGQAPTYYSFQFPNPAYDKLLVDGYDVTITWGAGPGGSPLVTVVPPPKGDSK